MIRWLLFQSILCAPFLLIKHSEHNPLIGTVGVFPKPWFGMTQSNRCSEFFSVIQRITWFYLFIPPFFKEKKEPLPTVWWDCQALTLNKVKDKRHLVLSDCTLFSAAIVWKYWLFLDPGSVWELWTVQMSTGCTIDPNERAKVADFIGVGVVCKHLPGAWLKTHFYLYDHWVHFFFFSFLIIFFANCELEKVWAQEFTWKGSFCHLLDKELVEMFICPGVCCTLKNKVAKLNHTGFWWVFLSSWHMEHIFRFLQRATFNYLREKLLNISIQSWLRN